MTIACEDEFQAVQLVLGSPFDSRGVDAFCLAWIKYERQLRKITAHLIYQASDLGHADRDALRKAFLDNRGISHTSTTGSFWRLTRTSPKVLIGERYQVLHRSLGESYTARERIFHGQQTGNRLSRAQLETRISYIREWCQRLSDACHDRFGYDGFAGSTSLFKTKNDDVTKAVDRALAAVHGRGARRLAGHPRTL